MLTKQEAFRPLVKGGTGPVRCLEFLLQISQILPIPARPVAPTDTGCLAASQLAGANLIMAHDQERVDPLPVHTY